MRHEKVAVKMQYKCLFTEKQLEVDVLLESNVFIKATFLSKLLRCLKHSKIWNAVNENIFWVLF